MRPEDYNITLMDPSLAPWQPTETKKPIGVMMSGGVDSSVTAHLLKEAGWDPVGITMKIPVACNTGARGCCGADAAFVCDQLHLPHYFVDVTEAFQRLIIDPFRSSYAHGQTPNPCIDCNTLLKFSLLWDFINQQMGIEHFATGHYAKILRDGDRALLKRGEDKAKDQSYFLYGIDARRINNFHLPLGDISKPRVREIAAQLKLTVADKAESMDLCFAGEDDYRIALNADQANSPGDLLDFEGNVIGTHKGVSNYTIGQRRGLGFAGGEPLYVAHINPKANTVTLGVRDQVSYSSITATQINILIPEKYKARKTLSAKIRSYGDPKPCRLIRADTSQLVLEFTSPIFAPSPGQRVVLYDENDCLVAGATITVGSL